MANDIKVVIEAVLKDEQFRASVKKMAGGLNETGKGVDATKAKLDQFNSSWGALAGAVGSVVIAFAGFVAGAGKAMSAYVENIAAMSRLQATAKATGASYNDLKNAAIDLSKSGLISKQEASVAISNLVKYGMSIEQATKTLKGHIDMALVSRQSHYELGQSIVTFTEGVKNENSVLSDATGMTKNISVIYKEYAESIGTTESNLTQAQKAQAIYNASMDETSSYAGNAEDASNNYAGATAQLQTALNELWISIGQMLAPAMTFIAQITTKVVTAFKNMSPQVKALIIGFAALVPAILAVNGAMAVMVALKAAMLALSGPAGIVAVALAGAATAAFTVGLSMSAAQAQTKAAGEQIEKIDPILEKLQKRLDNISGRTLQLFDTKKQKELNMIALREIENDIKTAEGMLSGKINVPALDIAGQYTPDSLRKSLDNYKKEREKLLEINNEIDKKLSDERKKAVEAVAKDNKESLEAEEERIKGLIAIKDKELEDTAKTQDELLAIINEKKKLQTELLKKQYAVELYDAKDNINKKNKALYANQNTERKINDDTIKEIGKVKNARKEAVDEYVSLGGDIDDTNGKSVDSIKKMTEAIKNQKEELEKIKETVDLIKNVYDELAETVSMALNAVSETAIQNLEDERDVMLERYDAEMKAINKKIEALQEGTAEQQALEQKIYEASLASIEEQITKAKMMRDDELAEELKRTQEKMQADKRAMELEKQYKNDLETIETNRQIAEDAYNEKIRQEKTNAAIWEKDMAITTSIINTAKAVTEWLAVPPVAAAMGVAGAIQTGIIAAQPIPSYRTGTERTQEGLAYLHDDERIIPAEMNIHSLSNEAYAAAMLRGLTVPTARVGGVYHNATTQNYDTSNHVININGVRNAFEAQNAIARVAGVRATGRK